MQGPVSYSVSVSVQCKVHSLPKNTICTQKNMFSPKYMSSQKKLVHEITGFTKNTCFNQKKCFHKKTCFHNKKTCQTDMNITADSKIVEYGLELSKMVQHYSK